MNLPLVSRLFHSSLNQFLNPKNRSVQLKSCVSLQEVVPVAPKIRLLWCKCLHQLFIRGTSMETKEKKKPRLMTGADYNPSL